MNPVLRETPWELLLPFGVDFGPDHLAAAVLDATDRHLLLARDNHGRANFPAGVALEPDQPLTPLWQLLGRSESLVLGKETISVSQLVARFLINLRDELTRTLPNRSWHLARATVAIPPNCPDRHQEVLLAAGQMAGLELDIHLQPLAILEYYAWLHDWTEGTWLVCDIGVNWEISLVRLKKGQVELLDSTQRPGSGGWQFDDIVAGHLLSGCQEPVTDRQQQRLHRLARALRQGLQEHDQIHRYVPDFWTHGSISSRPLEVSLTRADLEFLLADSLRKGVEECREFTQRAEAKEKVNLPLDGVLLAGGSSWVPGLVSHLQKQLGDLLRQTQPICHEPEWCVVRGAALHAAQRGKTYRFGGKSGASEHEITLCSPLTTTTGRLVLTGSARSSTATELHHGGSVRLLDRTSGWAEEIYLDPEGKFTQSLEMEVDFRRLYLVLADAGANALVTLPLEIQRLRQPRLEPLEKPTLGETIYLELLDSQQRPHRHPLAQAGVSLPATFAISARLTDQSGRLVLPLFQERRLLRSVVIGGLDPNLSVGSIVDIRGRVEPSARLELEVKVQATGWRERETCQLLPPLALPSRAEIEQLQEEANRLLPTSRDSPNRIIFDQTLANLLQALAGCEEEQAFQHWLSLLELWHQLEQFQGPTLHPPWPRFVQLVKHCLFLAGDVADRTGRGREELFEQVYAQERIAEQAYRIPNPIQYRECVANLLNFARYLKQLYQDQLHGLRPRVSDQQQRLERELLADLRTVGMLEGPI